VRRSVLLACIALALALGLPFAGAAEPPGRYQGALGGTPYLINVPPEWNGGLVMFAHGYQGEGSGTGTVRGSPLDHHLTDRGYAWAASGYRAWGYRPDWFLFDLLTLRAHFINRFGQPRWTIIHGQSMGGHIAIASLELHPEAYQGALIECGVIDGVGLADWRQAYTAAAEYFSGLPLLDTPRPEFGALVNGPWLELMGTPGHYTERGRRFDSVVKYLAGGDLPLRLEGLQERYVPDLNPHGDAQSRDPARRAGTGCAVLRDEPGFRRAHRQDPGAGAVAPRNRGFPRAVPARRGLPPARRGGRHLASIGSARGAPAWALRNRRRGARACFR
jgi:prolyl oligopeptidase family protein